MKPVEIENSLINNDSTISSAFSIASVKRQKKEKVEKTQDIREKLPEEEVTKEQLITAWKWYVEELENKGKKILLANISNKTPKLVSKNTLSVTFQNHSSREEFLLNQDDLLEYLKKKLNNYTIKIETDVLLSEQKENIVTSAVEKYRRLLAINPILQELKDKLDLDF